MYMNVCVYIYIYIYKLTMRWLRGYAESPSSHPTLEVPIPEVLNPEDVDGAGSRLPFIV